MRKMHFRTLMISMCGSADRENGVLTVYSLLLTDSNCHFKCVHITAFSPNYGLAHGLFHAGNPAFRVPFRLPAFQLNVLVLCVFCMYLFVLFCVFCPFLG